MQTPTQNPDLARLYGEVATRAAAVLGDFVEKHPKQLSSAVNDELGIAKAFLDLYARLLVDPRHVASLTLNL
ncbi:MAG: class I poly(R)-hydroxyalkanoic acid synthase, partial [Betaproteobacteria bacterium]